MDKDTKKQPFSAQTEQAIRHILALALRETWTIASPVNSPSFFDAPFNSPEHSEAIHSALVRLFAQVEESCLKAYDEQIVPQFDLQSKFKCIEQASIDYYTKLNQSDKESIHDFAKQIILEKQKEQIAFLEAMLAQKKEENDKLLKELNSGYQAAQEVLQIVNLLSQDSDLLQQKMVSAGQTLSLNSDYATNNF